MLPAHGYPKLKAYPHLKGNFGQPAESAKRV
jgi:hydroxylamine reductase